MGILTSKLIQACYREGNLIPIGKDPTDAEIQETLDVYRRFLTSLFGNDIGQLLNDWETPPAPTSANPSRFPEYPQRDWNNGQNVWQNPPPNVRLVTNAGIGVPVYFPPTPSDGARMALANVGYDFTVPLVLDGNGRLIEGSAQLTITTAPDPDLPPIWFYRADAANWVRANDVDLDTVSPLPPQFDDFLVSSMSIRRAPAYNKDPAAATVATAKHGLKLLKTTYQQVAPGIAMKEAWRMGTYQSFGTPWRWNGGGSGFG